jgi:hypothetical protein
MKRTLKRGRGSNNTTTTIMPLPAQEKRSQNPALLKARAAVITVIAYTVLQCATATLL